MDARIFASALASDGVAAMNMRLVPTCATRCPPRVRLIWIPGNCLCNSRICRVMTAILHIQGSDAGPSEKLLDSPHSFRLVADLSLWQGIGLSPSSWCPAGIGRMIRM